MMIKTRTPFRMSFFGGGTDVEAFFREHGGAVLSTTIDKYSHVCVRRVPQFFVCRAQAPGAKVECAASPEEIAHPAVRHAMRMLNLRGIGMTCGADLPVCSGLGTSSSFAVGMLRAFYAMQGECAGKRRLADEAIYLERVLCGEPGGWQDQIAAAFGGMNRINFHADGYEVLPISISAERKRRLNENLMLFYTGFTRLPCGAQEESAASRDRTARLLKMLSLVDEAQKVLTSPDADLDDFGRLLDHTWRLKRQTGPAISTASIDALYDRGIKAGALGGKLLGAGGGGFLLFYVPPERQASVRSALADLRGVSFAFENGGTQVVCDTPGDDETADMRCKR